MKNYVISVLTGVFLLLSGMTVCSGSKSDNDQQLRILCSPDIHVLAKMWAAEYGRMHPGSSYEVVPMTESQLTTVPYTGSDLCLVTDNYSPGLHDGASWKMVIGNEIMVPVISTKNAYWDIIHKHGVKTENLTGIDNSRGRPAWGMLLGNDQTAKINFYMVDSESIRSCLAQFTGKDPGMTEGIKAGSRNEILLAVQNDPYGIGFFSLTDLVDPNSMEMVKNIGLLPFDKNKNGKLDYFENIYGDLKEFTRGVWIGKYPKAFSTTIYFVSAEKPSEKADLDFLNWLVTGGQQLLAPVGYQDLASSSRYSDKVSMLQSIEPEKSTGSYPWMFEGKVNALSLFSLVIIVLIPFILAFMVGEAVVRHKRQKKASVVKIPVVSQDVFDVNSVDVPRGLFFDKTHMWAFMEKNGTVRIGVDDFLQHITGPLTSIKMREIGDQVKKGDHLLTLIQNGKQLSIHAPISGIIKDHNPELANNTSVMNSSPYADGWIYVVEPSKWWSEVRFLTMAEKYQEWLRKEFARLKDFVAASVKSKNEEFAHIILQDGGELKDGVLADLGPREWEEFQINFIDKSR